MSVRPLRMLSLLLFAVGDASAQATAPAPTAPTQPTTYHVVRRLPLGGEGGWDYLAVDTAHHRLFVSRGTHVMVVDTRSDSLVGDIPDTPGVHGIAIAPDRGRAYTSNGRDSSVTVVDLATLAPVARVRGTGANPDAILYHPGTGRVFAFNGGSGSATAIDAATNTVVGTVALGGRPEFAQEDGRGRVYVNLEDRSQVAVFDARTLRVLARWPLAPCEAPTGLAIDRAARRLFVGCSNRRLAVLDAVTGRVLAALPAGDRVDAAAFDPATRLAFVSGGDGTLTVAREDAPTRFTAAATVPTAVGGRTMALDPSTHRVYIPTARFGPTPAPDASGRRPRPPMVPGSFEILVLDP